MSNLPNIIAISGKQFAGKDTLAQILMDAFEGYHKRPIAMGIKIEFANIYGLTPQDIEASKSLYRTGLIALGQRRRAQDEDYWLNRVLEEAEQGPIIVSDLRLKHEYDVLKAKGAFMIRLETSHEVRSTRGTLVAENDATECELDSISQDDWNVVLTNDTNVEDLKKQALAKVQPLLNG